MKFCLVVGFVFFSVLNTSNTLINPSNFETIVDLAEKTPIPSLKIAAKTFKSYENKSYVPT